MPYVMWHHKWYKEERLATRIVHGLAELVAELIVHAFGRAMCRYASRGARKRLYDDLLHAREYVRGC